MISTSFPSVLPRFSGSKSASRTEDNASFRPMDENKAREMQKLLKTRRTNKWLARLFAAMMLVNFGSAAVNTVEVVSGKDITSEIMGSDLGDAGTGALGTLAGASLIKNSRRNRREAEEEINRRGFVIDDKGNLVR